MGIMVIKLLIYVKNVTHSVKYAMAVKKYIVLDVRIVVYT